MILSRVRREYLDWYRDNFPDPNESRQLLKFHEEVGELSAALYRNDHNAVRDAVADIFISWLGVCACLGIDPETAVGEAWQQVSQRRYGKDGQR